MKNVNSIAIIGGGTAGLITALILKTRFSSLQIDVIKSDKIGIIGVGEGSTEHWKEFIEFVGISIQELIKETDATFKGGIMFEDWTKKPFYHNVGGAFYNMNLGQYKVGYAYSIVNNLESKQYTDLTNWNNQLYIDRLPNQFHFNTFKLNTFLLKKCKERNINIIEDEIIKVNVKNNNIDSIESKSKKYKHDFFIDSTGFKRLLISELGVKWNSYSKYLPMNEAIAFPTPDTDEYPPYTLSKAMSAGWLWRIPTNGRWGNGYVFNNNYITAEQAKKECEDYLGYKVEIAKNIKFEAGAIDKAWIGNCVATGLSSSFIEPLEASSIGTSIQQAFVLMHLIINYKETDIELYNKKFNLIVENIRDFVLLHYITNKNDSKFWSEYQRVLPKTLENNLQKWKHRLPIKEDFPGFYLLFNESNFIILLKELNLIDRESIKKEFNALSDTYKIYVNETLDNFQKKINTEKVISHKMFLHSFN